MTLVQTAAIVGTILFGLLAILQISLLLGAPLGEFAWGGAQKKLDPNRRVGSGLNIVLYGVFSLMMLARAGFIYSAALEPILPFALWMMVAFASVGIFLNAITRSRKERAVMLPTAIVLFACQLIVAIG